MTLLQLQGVSHPKILAGGQGQWQGQLGGCWSHPDERRRCCGSWRRSLGETAGGGASGVKVAWTGHAGRLI